MSRFRFNAKNVFLTYPQCDKTKDELQQFLKQLDPRPAEWAIAQEHHQDGSLHLHAVVGYPSKINIRDQRHWDFEGHHPNIGPVRNLRATCDYIRKEDPEPLYGGSGGACSFGPRAEGGSGRKARDDGKYIELARGGDYKAALACFTERYPKEYVLRKTQVEENLRGMAKRVRGAVSYGLETFQEAAEGWDRTERTLFLWGPSGTGKTEYAKALLGTEVLLVRHMDQLKGLNEEHTGIVFDDCGFHHWPRESVIHLLDLKNDSGINVKHGCVVIHAGLPRVVTHNFDRDNVFPACAAGAIDRRLFVVHVDADIRLLNEEHADA